MRQAQEQGVELVVGQDKEKVIDFFINNVENVDILDKEIWSKTLISLGKKRKGDDFDSLYKDKDNKNEDNKKRKIPSVNKAKRRRIKRPQFIHNGLYIFT